MDKPLRERVTTSQEALGRPSGVRPPAPIRVDEEALGRALAPIVVAMERLAKAAEEAARILGEGYAQYVRAKRQS